MTAQDVSDVNRAGVALARSVAGNRVYVAASVGPLADPAGSLEHAPPTDDQVRDLLRVPQQT